MPGQSDQEKAAKQTYNDISSVNPTVANRFDTYSNPYGFGDINNQINDVYGMTENKINRNIATDTARAKEGAASNLASRGITNGSIINDTQSKIAADMGGAKANAISNLGISKAGAVSDLMKYLNQLKFNKTGAAQNVDQQNLQNLFSKFGLKSQATGGLDSGTWLDQLFSGISTIAPIAAAPFTGGTSLLGYLFGAGKDNSSPAGAT